MEQLLACLTASDLMPHGYGLMWDPTLVWLHVVSDATIALAYFSIPCALALLAIKRRDLPFGWVFTLFGLFIVACGTTHLLSIWTLWFAHFRLEGVVKAVTAMISVATAVALIQLIPRALALKSPADLERTVRRLEREAEEGRRKAEDALRLESVKLKEVSEELEYFACAASHDLQEPLRNVVACCAMLREDLGERLTPEADEDLLMITGAGNRMRRLIENLLALSRTGRTGLDLQTVSLDDCVSASLEALRVGLEESKAKVGRDPLPAVVGDRTLLTQLYQNLISNALKFNANPQPTVRLTAERNGDQWTLGVLDNGIGFESKYVERIFKPFQRLRGRSEYEGSGIGLAICQKTIERHGGKIWAESQPGEGSHFKFTLPANQHTGGDLG